MSYPRKIFVLYLLKLLVFLKKNINSDHLVFVTFYVYMYESLPHEKKNIFGV